MTATRLFIVGVLGRHLASTAADPKVIEYTPGTKRVVFPKPSGGPLEGLAFAIKRGSAEEFRSQMDGALCIAREVSDPDWLRAIRVADNGVEEARESLSKALRTQQETLAMAAARSKPAKVSR